MRMERHVFGLRTATALAVVAVIAATLLGGPRSALLSKAVPEIAARARSAEDRVRAAERFVRDAKLKDGVVSEVADRSIGSGLIGSELTPLTTTLGNLEAKRLATEPAWAGALVLRLHEAGLRRGDIVAAGFSGSFPGLNLAVAATSLVDRNGVLPAHAQPAWYMLSVLAVPSASRPPIFSSAASCCSIVFGIPFCASSSLIVPFWPSAEAPLSPQIYRISVFSP
jgi:hypothetical protein